MKRLSLGSFLILGQENDPFPGGLGPIQIVGDVKIEGNLQEGGITGGEGGQGESVIFILDFN